MPRVLPLIFLAFVLAACGDTPRIPALPSATAAPSSIAAPALPSATRRLPLPTASPMLVLPSSTAQPATSIMLTLSANQQIFATHTVLVATYQAGIVATMIADQQATLIAPPATATARPIAQHAPTKAPTQVPTKAPTKAPTAVAAQRPPTARPTAPLPPTPESCLTAAQTTYINQAEAIIDALHDAEAIIIASDQSQVPYGRDPTKTARSANASSDIWALQKRGQALHAPPGWGAAQVHWDAAMTAFNRLYFAYASPVLAFNEAEDNFIQFQLDLRDLIAIQCS